MSVSANLRYGIRGTADEDDFRRIIEGLDIGHLLMAANDFIRRRKAACIDWTRAAVEAAVALNGRTARLIGQPSEG